MVSFQRIVLIIAIVLLIICLIFIGIALNKTRNNSQWPPIVGDCPDYWLDTGDKGSNCVNKQNLGKCTTGGTGITPTAMVGAGISMDFTKAPYIGAASTCAKYKWANDCNITWDGITSGVTNPCIVAETPKKIHV